jgi:hypothetical protein
MVQAINEKVFRISTASIRVLCFSEPDVDGPRLCGLVKGIEPTKSGARRHNHLNIS